MIYVIVLVGIFILYVILKLHWGIALFLLCYAEGMVFVHRIFYRRQKESEAIFRDVCLYIDTMLYAFLRSGKIEMALTDTANALEAGKLKKVLETACDYIELTYDEEDVVVHALETIENTYNCKRVENLHHFMLHVENYGGDIADSVHLLLEDKNRWERRIESAISERRKSFREVVLSVVASVLICVFILHMPMLNVDISANVITQILSLMLLVVDDLIILRAQNYLSANWIRLDSFWESESALWTLRNYRDYNPKKARIASWISGGITGCVGVVCVCLNHVWIGCLLFLIMLFLLNQHTIGHRVTRRKLMKEIKSAFPNWLVDMVLLLQGENVQVSIQKSKEQAPFILLDDLTKLEDELTMDPESSRAYHMFLREFQIPQISFAMSMLYALSQGEVKGQKSQLMELVNNNYQLLDEAEQVRLRDKGSGMYLLFLAPVVTASLKLVVDMAMFLMAFMGGGIVQ